MRIVVALGGNAILHRGERGTASEQRAAVREACAHIAALAAAGHGLVLTHGNGPQVGRLMLLHQTMPGVIPPMPLDVIVAETQGQIGYVLQQELRAALARAGAGCPVTTIVTQVVVDPADPAFLRPTKPVGPFLSDEEAAVLRGAGIAVGRAPSGEGWRRLVPSPRPVEIVERGCIRALADAGTIPIACGGGGIPVVPEGNSFRGVEAVIDKDFSAALLARATGAAMLLILTDVEAVSLGFGTPSERRVSRLTLAEARAGVAAGEFAPGSMGPKIEAAISVVEAGGRAVVASIESASEAIEGRAGTEIVP